MIEKSGEPSQEEFEQWAKDLDRSRITYRKMIADGIGDLTKSLIDDEATGLDALLFMLYVDGIDSGQIQMVKNNETDEAMVDDDGCPIIAIPAWMFRAKLAVAMGAGIYHMKNTMNLDKLWDTEVPDDCDKVRDDN